MKQDASTLISVRNGEQAIKSQIDYLYLAGKYEECLKICEMVAADANNKK